MNEKEPTQQTQPQESEPITIPVPTRDDIDQYLAITAGPDLQAAPSSVLP